MAFLLYNIFVRALAYILLQFAQIVTKNVVSTTYFAKKIPIFFSYE
jgi:hypothetical protein